MSSAAWYRIAADVLAAIHAGLVLFALIGLAVIWIGLWRRWPIARNWWFRAAHLGYCAVVALLAASGTLCPLTVWEVRLRQAAGEETYPGAFVGEWIRRLLYVEVSEDLLAAAYVAFALLVLATWLLWPPERHARKRG